MYRTVAGFLGITIVLLLVMQVMNRGSGAPAPTAVVASASPGTAASARPTEVIEGSSERVMIARDASGQFHLNARVNGQDTAFLVDTGADVVALTVEDAERAGIAVDTASFTPIMQTASGQGNGARYTVDHFEVAGREFRDLEVVVIEGLRTNLLGQHALRRMGRVELSGDNMVIE